MTASKVEEASAEQVSFVCLELGNNGRGNSLHHPLSGNPREPEPFWRGRRILLGYEIPSGRRNTERRWVTSLKYELSARKRQTTSQSSSQPSHSLCPLPKGQHRTGKSSSSRWSRAQWLVSPASQTTGQCRSRPPVMVFSTHS